MVVNSDILCTSKQWNVNALAGLYCSLHAHAGGPERGAAHSKAQYAQSSRCTVPLTALRYLAEAAKFGRSPWAAPATERSGVPRAWPRML